MNFRRTLPEIRCLSPVCPPVRYAPFLALLSPRRAGGNIISPMLRMGMLCGALGCLLAWAPLRAADVALPPAAKTKIEFARDIEPLLAKRCLVCHGAQQQMSGLRLDQKEAALKGGAAGEDIVPGKSAESRLIRLVAGLDRKFMPPMGAHLTAEEVGLLRAWIDQGLEWTARAPHWSFQKIQRPAPPAVRDRAWGRNPVDNFILARLEHEGIAPSPEASKLTLIRRVSLDLTGLPPTPEQVREFLGDNRPDAYERLVDRLLDSPHYGEKWARYWLDLARYARQRRLRKRSLAPLGLALSPLGDRRAQSRPAVRRVHHRAARRRSAAQSQSSTPWSPPDSIATPSPTAKAAPIPNSSATSRCWIARPPSAPCGWASRWAARSATTTSSTPSARRSSTSSRRSSILRRKSIFTRRCPANSGPYLAARPEYDRKRKALLEEYKIPENLADWEAKLREAALHPGEHDDWDFAYGEVHAHRGQRQKSAVPRPRQTQRTAAERHAGRVPRLLRQPRIGKEHCDAPENPRNCASS